MKRPPRACFVVAAALTVPLLAACPPDKPPVSNPGNVAGAPSLESQIRSGGATLLAGVSEPGDKKTVMKQVSKQLGTECDSCHDISDFTAATVNKKIGDYMFAHFSVALVQKGGGLVDCNFCHQGQQKFLGDRAEKDRIRAYMQASFVDKLQVKGGAAVTCETCHGTHKDQPFLPRSL